MDSFDNSIFTDSFEGSGTATGPTVLGGVRVPVGQWSVGGEVRWQKAKGDLPTNMGFAGSTVDLGSFELSGNVPGQVCTTDSPLA